MGIPSYYKKLCSTIRNLRSRSVSSVDWFFMDFNCLIYHCLHRADTPVYNGANMDSHNVWETQFIECIVTYCRKVIQQVAPKKGVYIAIDGVVPMAKMRQQRLRRFKSVWLKGTATATQEWDTLNHVEVVASTWDTNAITPGTHFMTKLRIRLETLVNSHPTWHLSSSDEPGEGEHKIMAEWRRGVYQGNFAVYGLDADLVVLSLIGRSMCSLDKIWLFREEIDKGAMAYDNMGEEIFEWFSIHALSDWLCTGQTDTSQFILNYCFAMSVLGNDFLPSSLGFKIRDNGHDDLITIIQVLTARGLHLIDATTCEIRMEGVNALFARLAADEPQRILQAIIKKKKQSYNCDMTGLGENNWPLAQMEENILLGYKDTLSLTWKDTYCKILTTTVDKCCKEYLYGMQWVWSYYTGANVCFNWYYPFSLPPLYESLALVTGVNKPVTVTHNIYLRAEDIRPVEQLALVLPLQSWSLIPLTAVKERLLPRLAPQFYPTVFSFDSMGKRFFWECEAMIPMPSMLEIKRIIA